jgi:N-methylhydantoinase A/oxoprolinase/acetone carboxylase beta subunit
MPYRLGVDVGGTFTDLILVDEKSVLFIPQKSPVRLLIHRLA